jgi:alpha-glucoside transport system permease protein
MILTRVLMAVAFLAALAVGLLGWLWLAERVAGPLTSRRGARTRRALLGWLWLAPAAALVATFLAWPLVNTVWLSLRDAGSRQWVGLRNYDYLLVDAQVRSALRNNLLWLVLLTGGCLAVGLAVAALADRARYGALAKAAIVLPTAIPFVAGAVVWRFMYQYQPPGLPQIGTVNAVWTSVGGADPVAWLVNRSTNNVALVVVGIWMTAGFATVIIAAALTSIPPELREAATVDGATSWQVFRHITLPHLRPTLVVTATLLAVTAFKAFDIVYVMTNGNFNTDVIANVMYRQLFVVQDNGRASAIAVLLALLAVPVLVLNSRSMTRSAGEGS